MYESLQYDDIIQTLKLLGHPIRLAIVELLVESEQLNVGVLVDQLDLPQATVSQQLAKLKASNIVDSERDGTKVYYSLSNAFAKDIVKLIHDKTN